MKSQWYSLWCVATIAATIAPAHAAKRPLEQVLRDFDRDTKKFMNTLPEKSGPQGVSKFSRQDILDRAFIEAKNSQRKQKGRAAIVGNDRPEALVDNAQTLVKTLEAMEQKRLRSAKLSISPWSDYYWSLYAGQTAYRYADSKFPFVDDWKKNADYVMNAANFSSVDKLSPAEKYDLLVGDSRKTLTATALAEGEQYYRSNGSVEQWMGICHGWAPAAYMMDRPKSAVSVMAADGKTMIKFLPSDIKALASLLWAKNGPDTRFIGGRCNVKDPKKDENGRVIDQDCFDNNPGAWHMAVVNQLGVSKRSMVLDATFDYEVWNHPIYSYEYKYFNPQTLKPVNTLKDAMVPMAQYSKDKFKKYRARNAAYVVGISMTLNYTIENMPSTSTKDSAANDSLKSVDYQYDLELDAQGNIIGGEWYTNLHPDFLWTPAPNARAVTPGDQMLARTGAHRQAWDGKSAMPRAWSDTAIRNSQGGAPMATIVESLIKISNSAIAL
jgi:hypothetical protein